MRRALVGCLALSLGAPPIGVFLMLRRMSLMGDAMSHAILPGAAIGFLVAGLSLTAMSLGGFVAGLAVALAAGLVARATLLREDASLAAFYLVSLALGVLIVSVRGSNIDLLHVLFGTVLALDDAALMLLAGITTVTLMVLAVIYRPLVLECFDPQYLRSATLSSPTHLTFLVLVVLNLVAGFQALGTLMAVGMMLLPAVAARFWAEDVSGLILVAGDRLPVELIGLLVSYYADLATGPAIILTCGVIYLLSMLVGVARRAHLPPRAAQASGSLIPLNQGVSCHEKSSCMRSAWRCSPARSQRRRNAADKLKAVASFSILGDMVKQVGGDRVDVVTLVGPDGDAQSLSRRRPTPRRWRPRSSCSSTDSASKAGWTGWKNPPASTATMVASTGVKPRTMVEEEGGKAETITDPHAWQDLGNGKLYVVNIRDALIAADPDGKAVYEANAAKYLAEIMQEDDAVKGALAKLSKDRRKIITSHDAFGYFGAAYGLEVIAPEGVSTESEASAQDVAKIIRQIKAEHIPAVFMENITDHRLLDQIARETDAKIGGKLYTDALSGPDGPAPTYLDMFRHNVGALTAALSSLDGMAAGSSASSFPRKLEP